MKTTKSRSGVLVQTRNNQYAFHYVRGDRIRGGTKADTEGAVVYVGDSLSKHYVDGSDLEGVPEAVIETVESVANVTLVEGVEGGWADWGGRPEFSETYVDVSDMTEV